jgi:hypothetical protein
MHDRPASAVEHLGQVDAVRALISEPGPIRTADLVGRLPS